MSKLQVYRRLIAMLTSNFRVTQLRKRLSFQMPSCISISRLLRRSTSKFWRTINHLCRSRPLENQVFWDSDRFLLLISKSDFMAAKVKLLEDPPSPFLMMELESLLWSRTANLNLKKSILWVHRRVCSIESSQGAVSTDSRSKRQK